MGKYNDWTNGESEAILNIIGGTNVARAVLRGERKIIVEPIMQPSLVGTVVKTVPLEPYQVSSVAEAIKLGNYNDYDKDIVRRFASDKLGLTEAVNVDLVQFDRNPLFDEMMAWGHAHSKTTIMSRHLYGIGIQYPNLQRDAEIVELGFVERGRVLYLQDVFGARLIRHISDSCLDRDMLFGFVDVDKGYRTMKSQDPFAPTEVSDYLD